jgi:hypothetical protein
MQALDRVKNLTLRDKSRDSCSATILFSWAGIQLLRFHPHAPPIRSLGIGNHAGRAVNGVNAIVDRSDWYTPQSILYSFESCFDFLRPFTAASRCWCWAMRRVQYHQSAKRRPD